MDDKEKGKMFTFALGKFSSERSSGLVIILKGKHKLKRKRNILGDIIFSDNIGHKDYITHIRTEPFEKLTGKKLKAGEVRHGRLKLRLVKRKKK